MFLEYSALSRFEIESEDDLFRERIAA